MIAGEDRMDEGAVDRPAVGGAELGKLLGPFGERRAAFAGPHHGVERKPRHHVGVVLGKQRSAQRARRNPIDEKRPRRAAQYADIACGRETVLSAASDRGIVVASLGRASIALHVHAPSVVAATGKEFHGGGVRPPRHVKIEGRLRRHGGAMDEQDGTARRRGIADALVP
jgi:hypothetical protein